MGNSNFEYFKRQAQDAARLDIKIKSARVLINQGKKTNSQEDTMDAILARLDVIEAKLGIA